MLLLELIIFLLLLHLAYDDWKNKEVYFIECFVLLSASFCYFLVNPNLLSPIFALCAIMLPIQDFPSCDRLGMASLAFIGVSAMVLSVIILLALSRLKITTAYFPAAFIAYATFEALKNINI